MIVRDVMNTDVKTIKKDATIQEAADLMSKYSIGSLIVVVDSRVIGIITERDILKKVVAAGQDAAQTKVKDIMTEDVIMIGPDTDIEDAAEIMMEKRIKKLPVVSQHRLIGIITATDLCTASPKIIEQLGTLLLLPRRKRAVAG